MISDTSSVLPGLIMQNGTSANFFVYELHSLPACASRSFSLVERLSSPTIALKSAHAACNVVGAVSCFGGMVADRGVVELEAGSFGVCLPRNHPPSAPTASTELC